jgi:predicted nucleic acid-binding protein
MEFIIDANVLFSALIRNSLTAELIFNEGLRLYAPDFFIDEFMKYEELILKKTHRPREEFITIMHQLKGIITVIPKEDFLRFLNAAEEISSDKKDALT